MMKKAFLLLLTGSLFLAGCGGSSKSDIGSSGQSYQNSGRETMMTAAETAAAAYDYDMEAANPAEGGLEEEDAFETEVSQDISLTSTSTMTQTVVPSSRKLIRNVYMNVETDAFDSLISQVQSKVAELSGYMEQSDISGSSITYNNVRPDRYASITARIPADKLDSFITVVEGSSNVTNKSESTQDVTLQYSDLESKKKTLSMEQERIWALLEKADTLEAVIALEERLSEIRYELESMESTLKLFDNQVEYSTIELSIHEVLPVDFTPVAPETVSQRIQKGFSKNVENVGRFFTDLFIGVVTGIPVWLPLLAVLALILAAVKRVFGKNGHRPLMRRRHPDTSPDSPSPGDDSHSSGTSHGDGASKDD